VSGATLERRIAARLLEDTLRKRQSRLESRLLDATEPGSQRSAVRVRVYGVLRRLTWLQARLQPALSKPWDKQSWPVRVALLLGAFELLHLDGVPARAAVHQAVALVGGRGAGGFVNAVLRKLSRDEIPWQEPSDHREWMEIVGSQPRWLVDAKCDLVGEEEARRWVDAERLEPPRFLRAAGELPDDLAVEPVPGVPGALRWTGPPGPVEHSEGFADGLYWIQDAAAQAVGRLLEAQPGESILDACAAPGGKAFDAATAVGPQGSVLAADISGPRLQQLAEAQQRLGLTWIRTEVVDLERAPWSGETFDRVLLDAPCSGLGVLRRHPDARWLREPGDSESRGRLQSRLLEYVSPAVRPGGVLVYSVCTFLPAETVSVIDRFLAQNPEFTLDPPAVPGLADGAVLRTYPHRGDMDAFYAVRMRRTVPC
jgi:16S rRNA (cytosine967-C5)-methyltransferase